MIVRRNAARVAGPSRGCRSAKLDRRTEALEDKLERRSEALEDKMSGQFAWLVGIQVTTLVAIVGALLARS
jgi:ABC-type uncharacterized transport system ATPase component